MKLKILILWLFTSSLLFSYESIGKFNGGRAIVKEGSKWGIIDSSYNEYFFSNYVEFAGKKLRIKEIKDFYNINKSKYIKNTPIKDGFICKVILEETVLDGINKFLYFTINGENLKIRDFTTKEHLQSTVFLTNPESNRFANNWIFQISNPQKYRKGIFEFNTFYLDTDTNGIVCGYQIFSAGKFDYIGSSQKEETNFKDIRIPVAKNNKWGYVDGEGNQKVDLKFKFAFSFHNNIGVVIKENGYYSFIDLEGNLNDNEFELLGSFNSNGEAVFLTKIYNNPELYKKNPRAPNEFHYKMGLIDNKGKIIKEVNDCQPLLDLAWDISFDANLFIKHYEKKNSRAEIKAYWDKQQIYKTFETIKTEDEKTKKDINVGGLIAGIFGPSTEEYIKQYTILTNYKNPYYLYPRNMTSEDLYYNYTYLPRFSNTFSHCGTDDLSTLSNTSIGFSIKMNPIDAIWKSITKKGVHRLYANILKTGSNNEIMTIDENLNFLEHDPIFYPNEDGIVTYEIDFDLFKWDEK